MPVGDRLKELRVRTGESLQAVADAIGASKAHIWELESNRSKNPSLDLLQKLATHFKTTVAFLIEEPEGDLSRAEVFFRQNTEKLSKLDDKELDVIQQLLNIVSKNKDG
jgi:transcriptional regulator with XRE-family HTH domain